MAGTSIENPVFLVGAERSGTTALRLMLDHHPRVAWKYEFELSVEFLPREGGWPVMSAYHNWLENHRVFRASGLTLDRSLDYPGLMNDFMRQIRETNGKPITGTTVHLHFDRILRIWPQARFIHLVRDPRDVAKSVIGMGWAGNVWVGVEVWIEAEGLWDNLRAELSPDRHIELQFESLMTQPEAELRRLCDFLGIEYDPAMLRYPEHTSYDAPDPNLVYQWKTKQTPREIQLVESRCAAHLVRRGYALSGHPPVEVTPAMMAALRAQDKRERVKFGIRRYGLSLVAQGYLARRLGLKAWERAVDRRVQAITQKHLK